MMRVISRIAQQFNFKKTTIAINNNPTNTMKEGVVKFFNNSKGFGFISPMDTREDVFVHQTGLIDKIRENDRVNYDLEKGKKGMNAVNVRILA